MHSQIKCTINVGVYVNVMLVYVCCIFYIYVMWYCMLYMACWCVKKKRFKYGPLDHPAFILHNYKGKMI